jgi:hypothetical protein
MGGHELHRKVVCGVASSRYPGVALAGSPVGYKRGELIEAGIAGVPVVGLVAGEVDAAERRVRELASFLSCPRRDQFGERAATRIHASRSMPTVRSLTPMARSASKMATTSSGR